MVDPHRTTSGPSSAVPDSRDGRESGTGTRCRDSCQRPVTAQAHCSVCHRTFRGIAHFDRHRRDGRCIPPADLGLVDDGGVWTTPEGAAARRHAAALLAQHRWRGAP